MALQKKVKWLFGLIVFANLVIVLVVILGAFEPPPPQPLPNPNGYDDFVKAGNLVTGNPGDYSSLKETDLVALVATNAEALKLLRAGLTNECRVPDDYSTNYMHRYLDQTMSQRKLVYSLCAEGRLAKIQNRTNDAADSFLDAERFGIECSQGGVIISKQVGIGCESLGLTELQALNENVDSAQCRKIARTIESLDAQETTLEKILDQDHTFVSRVVTLRERIAAIIHFRDVRNAKARFTAKLKAIQLRRRQTAIEFAVRAYELEKGKPPIDIANLVPDYLKTIPKDPATGTNLTCRVTAR